MFFKIDVLENFRKFHRKTLVFESLLIKLQAWRPLFKETPIQVLFCEICKIFKNTFYYRTPPVAASEISCLWDNWTVFWSVFWDKAYYMKEQCFEKEKN